jgi:hypothetical protein
MMMMIETTKIIGQVEERRQLKRRNHLQYKLRRNRKTRILRKRRKRLKIRKKVKRVKRKVRLKMGLQKRQNRSLNHQKTLSKNN